MTKDELIQAFFSELKKELSHLSLSGNYYRDKHRSILKILAEQELITDIDRNHMGDITTYSFQSKNITIEKLKNLSQAFEHDWEGVNKKTSGFKFFNSATVNRLTSITNKYIKQLKAFEPKPWWKCW